MKVISVNVGQPREWRWNGKSRITSIDKKPVSGLVRVEKLHLAGDNQANLTVHGGPFKAVYGYASENYTWWREQVPQVEFAYGSLGENLTTEGLTEETICIGDQLRIGSVILSVTQPRMPCSNLQFRFQRADMVERFINSGRHGFYFSVIQEGELEAGSPIEFVKRDENRISIADAVAVYYRRGSADLAERVAKVEALAPQFRAGLAKRAGA